MQQTKMMIMIAIWLVTGTVLISLGFAGKVASFWNGMGSGLLTIGVLQLLRFYRLRKDTAYREKMEIEAADERNHFIRSKAWAWAGYLFVLITSVSIIIFRLMGQEVLSNAAAWAVCFLLVLYWGAYMVLKRKY